MTLQLLAEAQRLHDLEVGRQRVEAPRSNSAASKERASQKWSKPFHASFHEKSWVSKVAQIGDP